MGTGIWWHAPAPEIDGRTAGMMGLHGPIGTGETNPFLLSIAGFPTETPLGSDSGSNPCVPHDIIRMHWVDSPRWSAAKAHGKKMLRPSNGDQVKTHWATRRGLPNGELLEKRPGATQIYLNKGEMEAVIPTGHTWRSSDNCWIKLDDNTRPKYT